MASVTGTAMGHRVHAMSVHQRLTTDTAVESYPTVMQLVYTIMHGTLCSRAGTQTIAGCSRTTACVNCDCTAAASTDHSTQQQTAKPDHVEDRLSSHVLTK